MLATTTRRLLAALATGLLCAAGPDPCSAAEARTVVSLTFDDGTADHVLADRLLRDRGLKGTFYINSAQIETSGYYLTLEELRTIATGGHEIAGHTLHHQDVAALPEPERERQICEDRERLFNWGFTPNSFAYPFGSSSSASQNTTRRCGYGNARIVGGIACRSCPTAESLPPAQPYTIRTPDSIKTGTTLADMQKLVQDAEDSGGGWVVLVFHKVCNGCDPNSISAETLGAFLDWLQPRALLGTMVQTVGETMETIGTPDASLIARIDPSSAPAGSRGLTMNVYGAGFESGSSVLWNGRRRATRFVTATHLTASIPASDLASPASIDVRVDTPGKPVSMPSRFVVWATASSGITAPPKSAGHAFPNPWRGDRHRGLPIGFHGLALGSQLHLFDLAGRPVRTLKSAGGNAQWDLANDFGTGVQSGYFFFVLTDGKGRKAVGRLVILR